MNRAPAFWAGEGRPMRLLAPVAAIWGWIAGRRMGRPPRARAVIPVIAVGNFTAGGAGKTPTVAALIALAHRAGLAPAVLSRGYGGRLAGPVRVDPATHGAADVGDEPLLLARLAPVVVSRDRVAGLPLVAASGADLLLLDDGFQNPALARDLALVVVDRAQGLGNGRVIPAGPLRAPLAVQFDHVGALVVVETGEATVASTDAAIAEAERRGLPIFTARLCARDPARLCGRRVLAFAGIGRPEKVVATLLTCGAEIVDLVALPDHHSLSSDEAGDLLARAEAEGLDLVTTAKDAIKLVGATDPTLRRLGEVAHVLDVDLIFDDEEGMIAVLRRLVATREAGSPS